MKYDYLIVGAGLFGATFAYEASKVGKTCLVIDKRKHSGGNVYCEKNGDINVHKYGAHIFHTNSKILWEYVNQFVEFNRYTNSPIANYKGEIFNLPFNMNTFNKLWGVVTPEEARVEISRQVKAAGVLNPTNMEEKAISLVGTDIYEKLIKGYSEKQWGRPASDLPAFIINRIPVRFNYDNNYFNDAFQGIPIGGYNTIINKMLEGVDLELDVEYFDNKEVLEKKAKRVLYTGMIDKYFNYQFGSLEYRSLKFVTKELPIANYQGNAVVNYTDIETQYTRIIEHKHFEGTQTSNTVITKEYPQPYARNTEPYYPINDKKNSAIYQKYKSLILKEKNVIFGGRLADYKYYDMHQVLASALALRKLEFSV